MSSGRGCCIIQPCDCHLLLWRIKGWRGYYMATLYLSSSDSYLRSAFTYKRRVTRCNPTSSLSLSRSQQSVSPDTPLLSTPTKCFQIARKASLNPPTVKFMSPSRESTQTEGTTQTARERTSNIRAVAV